MAVPRVVYWFERGGFLVLTGMPIPVLGESCTTSIKDFAIFPPHQKKKKKKSIFRHIVFDISSIFYREIYEILCFFHSKSKLTIMFSWNFFSNDFSGSKILIRNEKFQYSKIQDAGTNMADHLVCHIRSAILDFQKLEISTLHSDSATKKTP